MADEIFFVKMHHIPFFLMQYTSLYGRRRRLKVEILPKTTVLSTQIQFKKYEPKKIYFYF